MKTKPVEKEDIYKIFKELCEKHGVLQTRWELYQEQSLKLQQEVKKDCILILKDLDSACTELVSRNFWELLQ